MTVHPVQSIIEKTATRGKGIQRNHRRSLYTTSYEILSMIWTLQQEQDAFLQRTEKMQNNVITRLYEGSSGRNGEGNKLKKINHRYHIKASIGTPLNVSRRLKKAYTTVTNHVMILKALNMMEFSDERQSYLITNKGIEFLIVYEDIQRLFPFPDNDYHDLIPKR